MGGTAGQRRNEKAEREQAKRDGAAAAAAKAAEDASWAGSENKKTRSQAKKEEGDAAADARAASRAEAKRLAKLEEEEIAGMGKPKGGGGKKGKMTQAEIADARKAEAKAAMIAKYARAKEAKKETSEEAYAAMVDVKNENKEDTIEASGIDAAVEAMTGMSVGGGVGGGAGAKPGTTNMKAAYAMFEAQELPRLKEERPGLKMSQYKEALHKAFQKSPMNPQNFER
jgi:hypothetical protein